MTYIEKGLNESLIINLILNRFLYRRIDVLKFSYIGKKVTSK